MRAGPQKYPPVSAVLRHRVPSSSVCGSRAHTHGLVCTVVSVSLAVTHQRLHTREEGNQKESQVVGEMAQ